MSLVSPLSPWMANPESINKIIAPPYDVLTRAEVRAISSTRAENILHVTRADGDLTNDVNADDEMVYQQAINALERFHRENVYQKLNKHAYFIYQFKHGNHTQTGLCCGVNCAKLKHHEHTRPEKIKDRFKLGEQLKAQVSPVLLSIKPQKKLKDLFEATTHHASPIYDVQYQDVKHRLFQVDDTELVQAISNTFDSIDNIYIADGHHRSQTQLALHEAYPNVFSDKLFAVIFFSDELSILGYHRLIEKPYNFQGKDFLSALSETIDISRSASPICPSEKTNFGLYLDGQWYSLNFDDDPRLAVDILHQDIVETYFHIKNPREDKRIRFVGGLDAPQKIHTMVDQDKNKLGFTLAPISMDEIISIADRNDVLPPKSTWFEPKLLDGFLITP